MAKKAAMDEIGKSVNSQELTSEKIKEVLGMDPFEEIQGVVICASEYENPEKSLLGMIRLKKTTGNIEELPLGIPGYEKSQYRKYAIHSASPGIKQRYTEPFTNGVRPTDSAIGYVRTNSTPSDFQWPSPFALAAMAAGFVCMLLTGRWLNTQSITQPIEPKLTIARVQDGLEVHPTVQSFL